MRESFSLAVLFDSLSFLEHKICKFFSFLMTLEQAHKKPRILFIRRAQKKSNFLKSEKYGTPSPWIYGPRPAVASS